MATRSTKARRQGTCAKCGRIIVMGETIVQERENGPWVHQGCSRLSESKQRARRDAAANKLYGGR